MRVIAFVAGVTADPALTIALAALLLALCCFREGVSHALPWH